MPAPSGAVSPRVKRILLASVLLLSSTAAMAVDVDPKLEKAVRDSLPVCSGATVTFAELATKLPPRFKGVAVKVESTDHRCDHQAVGIVAPSGNYYVGLPPWTISDAEGKSAAEKLQSFIWKNLQMNVTAVIEPNATSDGVHKVTLNQATENGKLPLEGSIDAEGRLFFFGPFRKGTDILAERVKTYEGLMAKSPTRGAAAAPVTIVEFSDFECPSCKRSSGFVDPILAKHNGKVRYIRFDMPLHGHPWSFPASLAGRAIYRQKPDLFWEYKKEVYENQENLNSFVIWDWARGFAADHDIDLTQYDADLQSESIKADILKGAAVALSNDVRATPTYMVNGVLVDAGLDGKALAAYIDSLVK
jgi:protein-disulfide isomerase